MIPVLFALVTPAQGGDQLVDIPFEPPAQVPLFRSAAVVTAKGKVDEDNCAGAVEAALSEASESGTIVRVVVSTDDLSQAGMLQCRQRVAGDFIAASIVNVTTLVVDPGDGPSFAPVAPDRAVQLAALLAALSQGDLSQVSIHDIDGHAWLDVGSVVHADVVNSGQLDENARAAKMYDEYVPSWVARWAPVLGAVGEVAGAVIHIEVPSEDPARKKSKLTEVYRFAVPTAIAADFLGGRITDEQFLRGCLVHRAENARKPEFVPFGMDVIEGGLAMEGDHGQVEREGLDVDDSDMEGLDDEEVPVGDGTWERQ